MKKIKTIPEAFAAWENTTLEANKTLAADLAEHGITTWETALPHVFKYIERRHGVKAVENKSGKLKLDSSAPKYEAARKAMQRIEQALVPQKPKAPKAPSKETDIVAQRAEWFGKLDKKDQARFMKLIGK